MSILNLGEGGPATVAAPESGGWGLADPPTGTGRFYRLLMLPEAMKMTLSGSQALSSLMASKPTANRPSAFISVVTQFCMIDGLLAGYVTPEIAEFRLRYIQ